MVEGILIFCLAVALYHYLGYPLAVIALARLRRGTAAGFAPGEWPSAALVITAYNEEQVIGAKIRNSLSLAYPRDRFRIVVVTDGSSDATPDIVCSFADQGVECLHEPQRRGKAHALNRAVAAVAGDVVILSDANNSYSSDAIELLVRRLATPGVGGATGVKKVVADATRAASTGDGLYWQYESRLKAAESAIGGTVTGDGEIFAIRRHLYVPIPADIVNDDMYLTLRLVEQGYRVEYEPGAVAVEEGSYTIREDFNVKARMIAGGLQGALHDWRIVLLHGWFSVRFVSHKLLRWLMPIFLAGLLLANMMLVTVPFYGLLLGSQLVFYGVALAGWRLQARGGNALWWYVPFYFVTMNLAAAAGLYRFLTGRQSALWVKARR